MHYLYLKKSPLDQFDTSTFLSDYNIVDDIINFLFTFTRYSTNPFEILNPSIITFIMCYLSLIIFKSIYQWMFNYSKSIIYTILTRIIGIVETFITIISLTRQHYSQFITFIFITILAGNIYGQIPVGKVITATLQVPFTYSILICICFNLILVFLYRTTEILEFFVPGAMPMDLSPFLWIVEFISHLIKVISLAVRLCANISSGHVLIDILTAAVFSIISVGSFALIAVFIVFQILSIIIQLLEILISFLQALVSLILTVVYTNELYDLNAH